MQGGPLGVFWLDYSTTSELSRAVAIRARENTHPAPRRWSTHCAPAAGIWAEGRVLPDFGRFTRPDWWICGVCFFLLPLLLVWWVA